MAKLKHILELHDQHTTQGSLGDSLGDGYLLATNALVRNLRQAAVRFGYRFTNVRFHAYDVMPLVVLPDILREKTVPYRDNVSVLRGIEAACPGVFDFEEVPLSGQSANLVLHESAHGVAHEVLKLHPLGVDRFAMRPRMRMNDDGHFRVHSAALDLLLGEAFANSCEMMANLPLADREARLIFGQSSYLFMAEADRPRYLDAIRIFGFEGAFKAVIFSYLYSNFLFRSEEQCDLEGVAREILGRSMPTAEEIRILGRVFAPAFALDPAFRLCTATFYFRLSGYELPLDEAVDFNFARAFFEIPALRERLTALARIAGQGT